MTVKEFIEQNPQATLNMMTPGGYVMLTPALAADLLHGNSVDAHPGANEHWTKITAEELLPQEIAQYREHPEVPNCIYMITGYTQEHGKEITQFAGTMQTKCWRGQHTFEWDDISFEQEIIADDGKMNFYVPIYFDAYGIFGEAVSKLGVDDSYNVYANYDLDEGDISEYLQIVIKYGDGHDDVAFYQLTSEEQEMFLRKMDAYCMETVGKSIDDWRQEYRQEQSATAVIEELQTNGLRKSMTEPIM